MHEVYAHDKCRWRELNKQDTRILAVHISWCFIIFLVLHETWSQSPRMIQIVNNFVRNRSCTKQNKQQTSSQI